MQEGKVAERAWVEAELRDVDLGDERLNWRLKDTMAKMAAQPGASIPQACDDWADVRGSYRLLDNEKVSGEKILMPHYGRTRERVSAQRRVLAVQDTSYLDFSGHAQTEGLGSIGTEKQQTRGMVMHTALMLTEQGLPLGLGSQRIWVRAEQAKSKERGKRRQEPIAEKESNKWLLALAQVMEGMPQAVQVVHIGDSEADVYELFVHAQTLTTDLLVRSGQERGLLEPEVGLLWAEMRQQPVQGMREVALPRRKEQAARRAELVVRFAPITLRPPQRSADQAVLPPCLALCGFGAGRNATRWGRSHSMVASDHAGCRELGRCQRAHRLVLPPLANRGLSQNPQIRLSP